MANHARLKPDYVYRQQHKNDRTSMSHDQVSAEINALASAIVATVWEAAADAYASAPPNDGPVSERLNAAVRRRLAKAHPSIIGTRISKRTTTSRRWQPSRPRLCVAIARLIAKGNDWVVVPAEKRCVCAFPNKLFARDVAKAVGASEASAGFTDRSLQFAASEVMAAVVAEAKTAGGGFELHSSTDAAWQGSDVRGAGIAADDARKEKLYAAATRIADRLTQPELTLGLFG